MKVQKFLKILFISLVFTALVFGGINQTQSGVAMPDGPTDETKVPHYFGPYPNWANSPFTLPDATVVITDPGGLGAGAEAVASVGADGSVTGVTVTAPGVGYTAADAVITSATGTGATLLATVTLDGIVTGVTVDVGGTGYTAPTVTLDGGGAPLGNLKYVGNQLAERGSATEGAGNVFVILPDALPTGLLQNVMVRNQVDSVGQSFNAYVLRPTGNANEYLVVFDSGRLTLPALAKRDTSEISTFPLGGIAVQAGDLLAFYGQGIPVETGVGADIAVSARSAPLQGNVFALGSAEFAVIEQQRTYSFAASVVETSRASIDTAGAGIDANINTIATAVAYGGVEAVAIAVPGAGYTFPTVDFDMPNDPNGVQASGHAVLGASGEITAVVVDFPGSGYTNAPGVTIRNGTLFDPIPLDPGGSLATATTTLFIDSIVVTNPGAGYTSAPTVLFADPTGSGASATASVSAGGVTAISVTAAGTGYLTPGIEKFVDTLPLLGPTGANNLGQYISVAVPDQVTFPGTDYYVIAVVQHRELMHSDLAPSLLREYVQLSTTAVPGNQVPLVTSLVDGSTTPTLMPDGSQALGVDNPHYLGPLIIAQKDRAVRITFYNLLPTGTAGDLFMPVDTTIMGSGMGPVGMTEPFEDGTVMDEVRNPMCTDDMGMMGDMCFAKNRATLHLHGGNTPWISDGTPHQWITPAGEMTTWPEGVSVYNVPDMVGVAGVPDCSAADDGCSTFYYTNQQSARLMFYHDHAWGITRLNVYAGEAAGYLIQDPKEAELVAAGIIPADQIPLVIQERTFVPGAAQLAWQDPTWDSMRWGGFGNLWYHHVYMPAQNPGAPGGMSGFGRWMYSPWFWPPQDAKYDPIANPYYNMDPATGFTTPLAVPCNFDDPATWQYQEEPFCEPALIPSTPLISAGMEQFNDTPIVNGTAYPTITLDPKAYRFRILNAANDRFWNLQWYVGDPSTANPNTNGIGEIIGPTEVAFNEAELAAAQLDPVVFPTPDTSDDGGTDPSYSLPGPDWIVIGSEGGFLPAPAVVDGQQYTTWITDPTRFDAGLVDLHSLVLAPAERSDVIVDFSQFAGQTLILYNDAPAAYPARIPSYDYYTGAPDLMPVGAPQILPGFGPNTRTIMQVKIAAGTPVAFNLNALNNAFTHKADGSGAFESAQPPIIVGQAAYNSAYGQSFTSGGWCNAPGSPDIKCDGFARISEQGGDLFKFDTLRMLRNGTYPPGYSKVSVLIEPKALQDETSESGFDEFGRMSALLGVEVVPAIPGVANTVLLPYMYPTAAVIDTSGLPTADMVVTPIAVGTDGTQLWKITHNGVDTHPIHVHAYDAQILNRVTWDNIIKPPDPTELGWKETFRVSPLEDTYFILRPITPVLPFDLPNSIRLLSPMMMDGEWIFNTTEAEALGLPLLAFAPNGEPIDIINHYVNYGAEYVYHCHILSHEEMDMMNAVSLAYPPIAPSGVSAVLVNVQGPNDYVTVTWTDNSRSETEFVVESSADGTTWVPKGTVNRLIIDPMMGPMENTVGELVSFDDTAYVPALDVWYRVVAKNSVGDTWDYSNPAFNEIPPGTNAFPVVTTTAVSEVSGVLAAAPSGLVATLQAGPAVGLTWTDNAINETGFIVERSDDGGVSFAVIATLPPRVNVGRVTYSDATVVAGLTYTYRVAAINLAGTSAYSNLATIGVVAPLAPSNVQVSAVRVGGNERVTLTWVDNSNNEVRFEIQRSTDPGFATFVTSFAPVDTTTFTTGNIPLNSYYFRIRAVNGIGPSAWVNATPFPIAPPPLNLPGPGG
jgi:FtsP/CotA-like multicopper oxidase with cupredoxin domain